MCIRDRKHTSDNHNQSTGTQPSGDGHSRTKCIQYKCPQPAKSEAKPRTSKETETTSAHETSQDTNIILEASNSATRNLTPTRNNNLATYAQVTSSGQKTPTKYKHPSQTTTNQTPPQDSSTASWAQITQGSHKTPNKYSTPSLTPDRRHDTDSISVAPLQPQPETQQPSSLCLLYTSDAADE